ncbi:MAG: hypothetical protein IJP89_07085 [Synergistaceae bacterium]|nr:hypothetical protein [Synergistaceae bacterium]
MTDVTVPVSAFREGKASEVFEEVRREGTRLVVGDDDSAVCIIMRPEDYVRMSGEFYDTKTMSVAEERFNHIDRSRLISAKEFDKRFGFTEEDLEGWEDIELE